MENIDDLLIPAEGTLERLFLEKMIENMDVGVTYLDFIGTGITEENIDQIADNLRNNMFIAENEGKTND